MKRYPYKDAKAMVSAICKAAAVGEFDTREKFMSLLEDNPHIAVQGYNPYGKIFFWNQASALVYGHSEAAAVNQDLFELILPDEMRALARDMVQCGVKTGRMPESGACDLVRHNGERVSVYSGHLVFRWENNSPEFYCLDIPIDTAVA
jgi:hypothetical protein